MKANNAESIKLSLQLLRKILDNSFDEIFVTNAEGVVVYVNKTCEKHYGKKPAEMMGKTSQEMTEQNWWGPRLSPLCVKYKKRLTMEQKTCLGRTLLTTATPVLDSNGEVEFVIENVRDITPGDGIKEEMEKTIQFLKKCDMDIEEEWKAELTIPNFIVNSDQMKNIVRSAWRIARVNSNVLILGESGTGKSILAKYIHNQSPRKDGPFISINCASIPPSLIEAELFGYSKGAFTGASGSGKVGLIDLANGGTLFLDEIGEIPIMLQAKLLQVVQENQYYEVGGRKLKKADCRIIAATNRDLKKMIKQGTFREDLYYRLSVFEIVIPPLSNRPEDVIPLVYHFLDNFNKKYQVACQISQKCLDLLSEYKWPGNVRELENTIERLVVMYPDKTIDVCHLPKNIRSTTKTKRCAKQMLPFPLLNIMPLKEAMDEVKKRLVQRAYEELGSSYKVAEALNVSQSTAHRLIRRYCSNENSNPLLNP